MHEPLPRRTAIQDDVAIAHVLFRDIETRSPVSLKKVGPAKYASDPSTEILCAAYAADNDPAQLWRPGDPVPPKVFEAAANPNWIVVAHNDAFESAIEEHILAPRHGWPLVPIERHACTMAMALAAGLPARLGLLADALELSNRKGAGGERLIHQVSKPRRARQGEDPAVVHWFDDADRLQRLGAYCVQDVEVTRELYGRLPKLTAAEQQIWQLSTQINNRGFHVDRQLVEAARKIARTAAPEIDQELAALTAGAITSINQVAKLLQWIQALGCTVKTLDRKAIEKLLAAEDLPPAVRRALELRLGGARAAFKKIDSLLGRAGKGDRVRDSFRYCGAATGRWSGEGVQPQNLKRPTVEDLDAAIAAVATGDYAHVKARYSKPLAVVGNCIRRMITAKPGSTFIGGDFSSIESRVLAWVADERWKLDAYRRYDATKDPSEEVYVQTAARILGVPPHMITKDQRDIGKVADLACGYQGGPNAWRKFQPDKNTDTEVESFIRNWRSANPAIVKLWRNSNSGAVLAVQERDQTVRLGRIDLKCTGAFLQIKLPSGRKISYPQPRLIEDKHGRPRVVFADNAAGRFVDCRFGQGAYGGIWVENITSGVARDVMAEAMMRVEAAGYPIVLHVHDEIVCEVPIGFGSTEEFTKLMTRKPSWADLPIAASAWTGPRYRK